MANEAMTDEALVEEGLAYWAQRLSLRPEDLEMAVAAWRASQNEANNQEL